ncbi:MAG TPA: methyltransferase domain-containing protein [Ferruginibacter sp.]|nr:methyltransferase domain-containing protein [Ferruginibacter sp.]HRN91693.1 methyltransferase domain-containing protein [Ferruginibacter sp.]HRO06071.1 methyltransferase domain-containing protein [Ferruginibacter sp.]HRO95675.1 methyltransferase domain-containing protein [Ferruginibacter sp.]HRP49317.1 methyltransferase domain-containing protein [Ferruginibacter sp.]
MSKITNPEIVRFLKEHFPGTGFIDGLKIKYRSYICPFTSLLSYIRPGDHVGDIGCGSGQFLLLASHFARPASVYGIEISERLIQNANALFDRQSFKSYEFKTYDGDHLPERLGEMDILFLIDVLHHVPPKQQVRFIEQICAVMKPGARFILKDIDRSSPLVVFNKMHDIIFAGEAGNEISMNKAANLLRTNGMHIIEEHKRTMYVYPHYTYVAQKP